ncbi:hypothetical protein ES703_98917 [subsurface metagenome]
MSKDRTVYFSLAKGIRHERPRCFRCGDCCTYIPIEVQKEEAELIVKHIGKSKGEKFLKSITRDWETANVLQNQILTSLTSGIGWIIAPCMFIKIKIKNGRRRTICEIYHVRPRICRSFYCGKDERSEQLNVNKYTYTKKESQIKKMKQKIKVYINERNLPKMQN